MFELQSQSLNSFEKHSEGQVKNVGFTIHSSLLDNLPTASIIYKSAYVMPDSLMTNIGSSDWLQYRSNNTGDEYKILTPMAIHGMHGKGAGDGILWQFNCVGDFAFNLNSDKRKTYKEKYANEIVEDVIKENIEMSDSQYTKIIQSSDNFATIYRTLGENDLDFINKSVNPKYTISFGQPFFHVGLDKKIYYTSIKQLISSADKPVVRINLNTVNDELSLPWVEERMKKALIDDPSVISTKDYEMDVGGLDKIKNLLPAVYYTRFDLWNTVITEKRVYNPASNNEMIFPISSSVMMYTDSTTATATSNRPLGNIKYESQNLFDSVESFITIVVHYNSFNGINDILLPGQKAMVATPNPYSMYNGEYLIAGVEYASLSNADSIDLVLIRPNLEPSWMEAINDKKDSKQFAFPFSPSLNLGNFFKA